MKMRTVGTAPSTSPSSCCSMSFMSCHRIHTVLVVDGICCGTPVFNRVEGTKSIERPGRTRPAGGALRPPPAVDLPPLACPRRAQIKDTIPPETGGRLSAPPRAFPGNRRSPLRGGDRELAPGNAGGVLWLPLERLFPALEAGRRTAMARKKGRSDGAGR